MFVRWRLRPLSDCNTASQLGLSHFLKNIEQELEQDMKRWLEEEWEHKLDAAMKKESAKYSEPKLELRLNVGQNKKPKSKFS